MTNLHACLNLELGIVINSGSSDLRVMQQVNI